MNTIQLIAQSVCDDLDSKGYVVDGPLDAHTQNPCAEIFLGQTFHRAKIAKRAGKQYDLINLSFQEEQVIVYLVQTSSLNSDWWSDQLKNGLGLSDLGTDKAIDLAYPDAKTYIYKDEISIHLLNKSERTKVKTPVLYYNVVFRSDRCTVMMFDIPLCSEYHYCDPNFPENLITSFE